MLARSSFVALAMATLGCASHSGPSPSIPPPAPLQEPWVPSPEPTAEPADPAAGSESRLRTETNPRLVLGTAASEAPLGLQQFGRFVGVWECMGESRQPSGSWKAGTSPSTWTWFFTLDGHAVQDLWDPPGDSGAPVGINLRIYNEESNQWDALWASSNLGTFDHFVAREENGEIMMRGERPTRASYGAHLVRITFHRITEDGFAWKYESSPIGDGKTWTEQSRLNCQRQKADVP